MKRSFVIYRLNEDNNCPIHGFVTYGNWDEPDRLRQHLSGSYYHPNVLRQRGIPGGTTAPALRSDDYPLLLQGV